MLFHIIIHALSRHLSRSVTPPSRYCHALSRSVTLHFFCFFRFFFSLFPAKNFVTPRHAASRHAATSYDIFFYTTYSRLAMPALFFYDLLFYTTYGLSRRVTPASRFQKVFFFLISTHFLLFFQFSVLRLCHAACHAACHAPCQAVFGPRTMGGGMGRGAGWKRQ